jgi:hypothetical protein
MGVAKAWMNASRVVASDGILTQDYLGHIHDSVVPAFDL